MAVENMEFYIILPKQATNLVVNPSCELATTGYTAVAGSIARAATYQRRGVYSLEVTPNTGVESGVYFGTVSVTNGQQYSFSADVKGVIGQAMRIQVRSTAAAVIAEQTFTGNGYWERPTLTYTESATTTRRLYIVRDAVASTSKYYVDGVQYESGVASTYLDGDMRGFVLGQADYLWTGTPHASTSWRSGGTRSGGTMLRIKDYLKVIGMIGLGMALVSNLATPTSADFSLYQGTRIDEREINLVGEFIGSVGTMLSNRKTLIDAIKPDLTPTQQPVMLRYQGFTAAGATATEPVDLPVVYESGLEGAFTTPGHERINLQFRQYLPMLGASFESGAVLGYQTSIANFANIGYRDTDGIWKAMGTGVNNAIYTTAIGPDGALYAGGAFTLAGGVAGTSRIAKWNGSAWSALGTGMNGEVMCLVFGPDGTLYASGNFTSAGGVAGTERIAKWNGTSWSGLGAITNAGYVNALAIGLDGALYAGGNFASAGGVANTLRIAKWNGTAWSALGTGMGITSVDNLTIGPDGSLYAGGNFASAGGVAGTAYIAKWDGSVWSALGTGVNSDVFCTAIGPDGSLYAGGIFTSAGGIAGTAYIAKWNGTTWSALGTGMNAAVSVITVGPDGLIYAGGGFTTAGGNVMPDRVAVWTGSTWIPMDIDVQDVSASFYGLVFDGVGKLYTSGWWTPTTARSATVTVPNIASATAYPVLTFTGPGTVWQIKNYTNRYAIYFKNLTLLAGETATLDLRPGTFSFTSSFRGNLMNYLAPGSSLDFPLSSGNNNISAFMTGTTAASAITMRWTPNYWSVDGAVR